MNTAEAEEMAGLCEALGLVAAQTWRDAEVVILNSCSVRQIAEDKVYGWGKKWEKQGKRIFGSGNLPGGEAVQQDGLPLVILTGCMVGSARGKRKRINETELARRANFVDYFVDQGSYGEQLPTILMKEGMTSGVVGGERAGHGTPLRARRKEGSHAYIKISEGCDNFCTYCVVPHARGEERSKDRQMILDEVKALVGQGYEHITLLGQNVNSWGIASPEEKKAIRINSNQPLPFASLLREIHALEGLSKLSFVSSNPFDFTQDMIEVLKLPKIDRFLHMAVQSGSNAVLKRMNRRHTAEEFTDLASRIRQTVPDIELGTDLIVGFCGETDEDFEATLALVRTVRFNVAYLAMYSPRPGTFAATHWVDDVPKIVKKQRYERLLTAVEAADPGRGKGNS